MKIDINDLYGVKGIGDKTIERIKEQFREKEKQSKAVKNFDPIKIDNAELYYGDCLDVMDYLIDKNIKVDAIITDPPYGTTDCSWDNVIPLNDMWDKISKIIKDDTPIILFGNEPFSSKLRLSNINMYKYDWKWNKVQAANFLNVKYQPLKNIEDIMVFSLGRITNGKRKPIKYNPQGFEKNVETKINSSNYKGSFSNSSISKGKSFKTTGTGYPKCLIEFNKDREKLHPTQKPVALLEYLVKTYTNEGDIILDFTMGSGTTGVAAKDLNRKFIGIELEKEYFDISIKRLKGEIT